MIGNKLYDYNLYDWKQIIYNYFHMFIYYSINTL